MACCNNNGLFGGNACSWIIILLILSCVGDGLFGTQNANNGGCGCGCGCDNNCGC